MTPFAGNRVGADEKPPAYDDTAADPGPENDAKYGLGVGRGAVCCFGERKAVGVISQPDWPRQSCFEIALHWTTDQPRGVRVLDEPAGRGDGSRDADADRPP